MRQAERKGAKDKVAVALVLCFCVIALTSIFTIRANINKINNADLPVSDPAPTDREDTPQKPVQPATQPDSRPDTETPSKDESEPASGNIPTVDSLTSPGDAETYRFPVNAPDTYVSNEYAMDHLIYSVTLDQYMAHCGVDIEAPQDSQVVAMDSGTVTAVYVDDRFGNAVEVTHDGFIAIYANLSDASMVETGDTVEKGQIIGGVGTSGLLESLEPAHLHLEILRDGVYVDPAEYLS